MKRLICFAMLWQGVAVAKTIVIESPLPSEWPAVAVEVAAPVVVKQPWTKEEAPKKVRDFLAADYPAEKKIEMQAWWAGVAERPDFLLELAARCARAGQIDPSFYWMQRAAREDVCEAAEIEGDDDFAAVRKDGRWAKVREYLRTCEAKWQESSFHRSVLTLPEQYDGKSAIPVVIGLHGFGSLPEDFAGADFQRICDAQGIAFLGVSGRRPLGRHAFMWTESFEKDWQHVDEALTRVRAHVNPATGRLVAIGFSQGGQLAAEIAAAFPDRVRGCVSMSPGSRFASALGERLQQSTVSLRGQRYFFSWISGEGAGPRQRVDGWRPALEKKQALVHVYQFPGKGHEWPRSYEDYFAITLQVILADGMAK
jgi:predicted esterase